jgi:hypothetical protein
MIKQILKETFSLKENSKPKEINVDIEEKTVPFVLSDTKSCSICQGNPKNKDRSDCNREILKINNNGIKLNIVNYEKYINQFNLDTNKCDYIITESGKIHEKIVFCELTCSNEVYVEPNEGIYPEGKRARARKQLTESLKHFVLQQKITEQYLLTFPKKICIFGWRDYEAIKNTIDNEINRNLENMQIFKTMSNLISNDIQISEEIMDYGFKFIQIKYPTEYNWKTK